jgi:hypothetical protein
VHERKKHLLCTKKRKNKMSNTKKHTTMKKIMFTLIAMLTMAVSANAMSYEQARNEALFLTDKMAYELNLSDAQYEAAYEINLDYLMGVTGQSDMFGPYWERRNLDLSYVLFTWQWDLFRAATYFYRPLYWNAGYWHFGIYARYPHRDYFFFGRPHFFATYRGGHSWRMNGGRSYYEGRRDVYRHGNPSRNQHFGMRNGWDRGDYRDNRGGRHSSTHSLGDNNRRGEGTGGFGNNRRGGNGGVNGFNNNNRGNNNRGSNFGNGTKPGENNGLRNDNSRGLNNNNNNNGTRNNNGSSFGGNRGNNGSSFGGNRGNSSSLGTTRSNLGTTRSNFGTTRSNFGTTRNSSVTNRTTTVNTRSTTVNTRSTTVNTRSNNSLGGNRVSSSSFGGNRGTSSSSGSFRSGGSSRSSSSVGGGRSGGGHSGGSFGGGRRR